MPSYRARPVGGKKPMKGAKPKMPASHAHMTPEEHKKAMAKIADRDMATAHPAAKPVPQKPRKAARKGR